MTNTGSPVARAYDALDVAVIRDIKNDGGQITFLGDGTRVVSFSDAAAARRMLNMFAEIGGAPYPS